MSGPVSSPRAVLIAQDNALCEEFGFAHTTYYHAAYRDCAMAVVTTRSASVERKAAELKRLFSANF